MPEQAHDGRAVLIEQINSQLNLFLSSIKTAIQNNLPNRNVLAETTLMGLLNLIHNWNLVNANSILQNFPGIDLIDTDQKIGIQVTSTNTLKKVDNTLEKVAKLPNGVELEHLHIMVITTDAPTSTMKARNQAPYFSGIDDIWNISTLLRQIMDLPIPKLEAIRSFMDSELGTLRQKMEQKYLNLPLSSALDKDSFVGRETEMEEIWKKLRSGAKPIVLSGLGGMGKTELAVHFGLHYTDGNVYFIRFNTSFTATVTAMFRGVSPQPQDPPSEDEQYQTVMALLRSCGERDLLIIDNVDADSGTLRDLMKDKAYRKLKDMKLRLLLTTRFDEDRAVRIRPMPNETLYEIFDKHGVSLEESKMDELIEAVNGHTLTIDLIARTLNGKGWRKVTPEMLLEDLRNNTLPSARYRKIATDYNQSEDQAQIYQHLSVVFNVTEMPEDECALMCCATLLPSDGMDSELFAGTLSDDGQDFLDSLIDHGWLNAEDGLLTIHPVIRLVCREELKPSDENCSAFLDALWGQFDPQKHERVKFAQMAELFGNAANTLEDQEANWLNYSGRLWNILLLPQHAKTLYEKYIPDLEKRKSDPSNIATAYLNLGSSYDALGNFPKALECKLKALEVFETTSSTKPIEYCTALNNVGTTYGHLGNSQKALEYKLKALSIVETSSQADDMYLAITYNNIGSAYWSLSDHEKALQFQIKALRILEKILPADHPDLATSYNNTGTTYQYLRNYRKSAEYLKKAVLIYEKVLPPTHPDLARAYANLGSTYSLLGNQAKSLEFNKKALEIYKKESPFHPNLAKIYDNLSAIHLMMGNYTVALDYLKKATSIREQCLPPEHPDLIVSRQTLTAVKSYAMMSSLGLDPRNKK